MMLVLVVLVVTTAVASAGAIVQELDEQLVRSKRTELRREVDVQAVRFQDRVDELVRDVRVLAGTPPIQGIIRATEAGGIDPKDGSSIEQWRRRLEVIFAEILGSKPTYLQARYIGIADGGRELIRVERSLGSDVSVVDIDDLQQKGDEPYFRATIARGAGKVYLSQMNLNRENGAIEEPRTPVLRAALPIFGSDGEPFGIVIINHALAPSLEAMVTVTNSAHRYFVVNAEGAYLAHPDPARAFEFEDGASTRVTDDFPEVAPLIAGEVDDVNLLLEAGVLSARRLHFGPRDQQQHLVLIATTRFDDVTAISRSVLERAIVVVTVFVAFALVIGVWLANSATAPIVSLARTVREHAAGGFEPPAGLSSEAAELADALADAFERIDRHTRDLEAMNKELGQFAYIASHDLQEPVRTISSLVGLLAEQHGAGLDDEAKTALGYLSESSARATALIHGLLEYSRLGREAVPTSVDLERTLYDVQRDLDTRIRETHAKIHVGHLPTMTVYETEVRMLFQNLLTNAIKFQRPNQTPEIHVSATSRDGTYEFAVEDNGIGIAPEHRERVFLIYQRLHNRGVYEGTGIGLAHCSKIVALHRGRIWVEESAAGGARFCFTLRDLTGYEGDDA